MAGWLLLTTHFGTEEIDNPSHQDLSDAIEELRRNDIPEVPDVWLRSEVDGGAVYLLIVSKDGAVTFSKYVSAEADDPIVELAKTVSLENALEFMTWLAEGKVEQIEEALVDNLSED